MAFLSSVDVLHSVLVLQDIHLETAVHHRSGE